MARRIPLWAGTSLTALATLLTILLTLTSNYPPLKILCWFGLLYFPHCLSHYVVGRLLGIRFRYYYFWLTIRHT